MSRLCKQLRDRFFVKAKFLNKSYARVEDAMVKAYEVSETKPVYLLHNGLVIAVFERGESE